MNYEKLRQEKKIGRLRNPTRPKKDEVTPVDNLPRSQSNRKNIDIVGDQYKSCLLYTSPSPRDRTRSRMPSSA